MFAELNHGRWIVCCPEDGCTNAELATTDRFLCSVCGERGRIVWPVERGEIERLTLVRPVKNRNWTPGESVALLVAENLEHEVRI